MKIYSNVNKVISLYKDNTSTEKASGSISSIKKDEVHISQAVKDMSRYIEIASKSEITSDKVNTIKQKIINNEYKIDCKELARALSDDIKGSSDK